MNTLEKIDDLLINGVEAFSHKFQILTGKNCFFLAKVMLIIAICISFIGILYVYKDEEKIAGLTIAFTTFGVIIVYSFTLIYSYKFVENECIEMLKRGLKNPARLLSKDRISLIIPALLIIFFSIPAYYNSPAHPVFLIFMPFLVVCIVLSIYFSYCTPLPPGISKVKQWINSFKKAVSNVLVPEQVVVPVKAYGRSYWFPRVA